MPTLNWIGKEKVVSHHQDVPYRVLEHKYHFDAEKGETSGLPAEAFAKAGNKIIHGDNLEALKSLLPEYEGKVKCIYIDPPYNTGKEKWQYNDNVNHPKIKKWLGEVVGKESEDLTRHDKWLCMMYPRIKLLHKLLSQNGVLFMSLDDNEITNAKLMCDEIFGSGNYMQTIIWKKRSGPPNDKVIGATHEYILLYSRNINEVELFWKKRNDQQLSRYSNPDNHVKGRWAADNLMANVKGGRFVQSLYFPIINPNTKEEHYPSSNGNWRYNKEKIKSLLDNNEIYFGKDGKGRPKLKRFLNDVKEGTPFSSNWDYLPFNNAATKDILEIFGSVNEFDTPKPVKLIEEVLILSSNNEDIILDSFAGSGTTAHAVLNLNKQDGGNRKFILVEMEDYANDITAERVKRVAKGYGTGAKAVAGTGGAFDFYELGLPLFDENQNLNEQVGLAKIREYIWFSETRSSIYDCRLEIDDLGNPKSKIKNHQYELGVKDGTVYYFIYEKNKLTTLDFDALELIKTKGEQYVIYADTCLLPKDFMAKKNIIFKKIPRDITRF
jgi:adenine-specific DNA-methyltransferase